jgi:leucyl-tRNA synthetase
VLATYGTGAIMAVPGHDLRDWEFAKAFKLPIRFVVEPPAAYQPSKEEAALASQENGQTVYPFIGEGTAKNSAPYDGLSSAEFKKRITEWLEFKNLGKGKINYKLRDWLFSRQRYWGEPFPILHELDAHGKPTGRLVPLEPSELPLRLPDLRDYKPSGKPEPPLAKATDWVHVTRDGKKYLRETNTMPQWAGSCWYYLRYLDAKNDQVFCDPAKEKHWMPIDLYVGGAEHAVLHLLYSRFWHKVLHDRGHVSTPEPFQRLVNQGMILGEMEFTVASLDGRHVAEDDVEKQGDRFVLKADPSVAVEARAYKMSKSRGNVINPDQVIDQYGADSMRLYEMFMGPLEATKPWSMRGVEGVYRFLNRVWRLLIDDRAEEMKLSDAVQDVAPDNPTRRLLHVTIKRVTEDLDAMAFNTAISAMMELSNHLTRQTVRSRAVLNTFVLLLSPFAPHLAEELWRTLGHKQTPAYEPWPAYDEVILKADEVEIPVQINGKLRGKVTVPADTTQEALQKTVLADDKIQSQISGKTIKKVIVVPGKLVNLVVG